MKNRIELEDIDYEKKTDSTKKYDIVGMDIRKLMTASLAKFIPDLADALKEDWYPHLTKDMIQANPKVREEIAHKIVGDWSKEENDQGVWSSKGIGNYIPSWLKNPANIEAGKMGREVQLAQRYQKKVESQKEVFDLIKQLPKPPEELKEDLDEVIGGWSTGPSKYHRLGDDKKSPLTKMGDIRDGCRELFFALTDRNYMPNEGEDLLLDHIKPTREYRKFIHELDEREQVGMYNWLVYTEAAIKDMLNMLDEVRK